MVAVAIHYRLLFFRSLFVGLSTAIQIFNDGRVTSVLHFSSKNGTLLVYMIFRLVQIKVDYFCKCPLTTIIAFQGFQSFSDISLV